MIPSIKCRTLLGHKNLLFSIDCLKSFVDNAYQSIQLEIFEDGSLTDSDKSALLLNLPGCTIITKDERSVIALEKLSKYPHCLKWRTNNFYAIKLFDIMFYKNDGNFLYIDSDVMFYKKFKLPEFNGTPVFMIDSASTYSFGPLDFIKIKKPIYKKLNSGFFYFPVTLLDLDFLETLLQDPFLSSCFGGKWCGVAEQTLWSFLAAHLGGIEFFDPNQVCIAEVNTKLTANTIAIHLVTPFRYQHKRLQDLSKLSEEVVDYTEIGLKPVTKHLGKLDFVTEWIITKLNSKFRQLKKV